MASEKCTWSTTSVWDAERLVKIEMRNVGSVIAGTTKSDLSIHVGTVEENLKVSVNQC